MKIISEWKQKIIQCLKVIADLDIAAYIFGKLGSVAKGRLDSEVVVQVVKHSEETELALKFWGSPIPPSAGAPTSAFLR